MFVCFFVQEGQGLSRKTEPVLFQPDISVNLLAMFYPS